MSGGFSLEFVGCLTSLAWLCTGATKLTVDFLSFEVCAFAPGRRLYRKPSLQKSLRHPAGSRPTWAFSPSEKGKNVILHLNLDSLV